MDTKFYFLSHMVDDTVFMENNEHHNEYVMEDFGYIWRGISGQFKKIPWAFGQVRINITSHHSTLQVSYEEE